MNRAYALVPLLMIALLPQARADDDAVALLTGADFAGGAKDHFGGLMHGEQVNYVYAQPTGPAASMRATFNVDCLPTTPMFLHVKGRNHDTTGHCAIEIALNGTALFSGPNAFPGIEWQVKRFPIPAGALKAGANQLTIKNQEPEGKLGMPPWFMVAACTIAPEKYVLRHEVTRDFYITLPKEVRPLPEPLPQGARPGFAIRGIKGWNWTPEQYLAEIPVLARYKMNFLMNCYTSIFSGYPRFENRWWEPMSEDMKAGYAKVIKACQENGIDFCFAVHPQFGAPRPMNPASPEDFDKLWPHFAWAQGLGVKWFGISLDDIQGMPGVTVVGEEHALLVNKLLARLREKDPQAQFVLCPTWYWGDGTMDKQRPYLEAIARELDPQAYLFWTGDGVVGNITRKAAETYRGLCKHRLILWDNYPVNDHQPTLHLGPVMRRDRDLHAVIDGYMSNPLCPQNEINRIPLLTCADYAYNPEAYDPGRSIGQAILHLADDQPGREALRDLTEAYAGMLVYNRPHTGMNSVREQYTRSASAPHARFVAAAYIRWLEDLSARMDKAFPDRYRDAKKTLDNDIVWAKAAFKAKYGA